MPLDKGLFRKEAVARRGHAEPIDGLLRVTAPHEWMILLTLVGALLALAGWGFFGSIERSLVADCVLVRSGDRHPIISEVSGSVVEMLADVGDVVGAGQPIARVGTPELNRQVRVANARIEALEALEAQGGSTDTAVAESLRIARAELLEFEAARSAGEQIVSPHAGEIASSGLAVGQAVAVGERIGVVRGGSEHRFEAVAFVPSADAGDIEPGMAASVLTAGSRSLEATVSAVSERPAHPAAWLTDFGLTAAPTAHGMRVTLLEAPGAGVADGDGCRLRVVLRTEAPVRLVAMSAIIATR